MDMALREVQSAQSQQAARLREAAAAASQQTSAAARDLRQLRAAAAAMRDTAAAACNDTVAALRAGVCGATAGMERELRDVLGRRVRPSCLSRRRRTTGQSRDVRRRLRLRRRRRRYREECAERRRLHNEVRAAALASLLHARVGD
jgi:hypothetical protein